MNNSCHSAGVPHESAMGSGLIPSSAIKEAVVQLGPFYRKGNLKQGKTKWPRVGI